MPDASFSRSSILTGFLEHWMMSRRGVRRQRPDTARKGPSFSRPVGRRTAPIIVGSQSDDDYWNGLSPRVRQSIRIARPERRANPAAPGVSVPHQPVKPPGTRGGSDGDAAVLRATSAHTLRRMRSVAGRVASLNVTRATRVRTKRSALAAW